MEKQGAQRSQGGEPELDKLADRMASSLPALDCPQDCGPVYEFIEFGAAIHHEELQWACVVHVMRQRLRAG